LVWYPRLPDYELRLHYILLPFYPEDYLDNWLDEIQNIVNKFLKPLGYHTGFIKNNINQKYVSLLVWKVRTPVPPLAGILLALTFIAGVVFVWVTFMEYKTKRVEYQIAKTKADATKELIEKGVSPQVVETILTQTEKEKSYQGFRWGRVMEAIPMIIFGVLLLTLIERIRR